MQLSNHYLFTDGEKNTIQCQTTGSKKSQQHLCNHDTEWPASNPSSWCHHHAEAEKSETTVCSFIFEVGQGFVLFSLTWRCFHSHVCVDCKGLESPERPWIKTVFCFFSKDVRTIFEELEPIGTICAEHTDLNRDTASRFAEDCVF